MGKEMLVLVRKTIEVSIVKTSKLSKCVLFLLCRKTNLVRIVSSDHPVKITKRIDSESPEKLVGMGLFFTDGNDLKIYLKDRFKDFRRRGNWFEWNDDIRSEILRLNKQVDLARKEAKLK